MYKYLNSFLSPWDAFICDGFFFRKKNKILNPVSRSSQEFELN